MFEGGNIHYEMSEKVRAMNYGGIGLIHTMVKQIGLDQALNRLELLKFHVPYHESDHVLNIAYNVLLGGKRLEDIELRRNDEVYLDALGAQRIPDPTTAGDFTRRFDKSDNQQLMDAINEVRARIWPTVPGLFRGWTYIDADGTLAGTLGECKQGIAVLDHNNVARIEPINVFGTIHYLHRTFDNAGGNRNASPDDSGFHN